MADGFDSYDAMHGLSTAAGTASSYFAVRQAIENRFGYQQAMMAGGPSNVMADAAARIDAAATKFASIFHTVGGGFQAGGALAFAGGATGPGLGMMGLGSVINSFGDYMKQLKKEEESRNPKLVAESIAKTVQQMAGSTEGIGRAGFYASVGRMTSGLGGRFEQIVGTNSIGAQLGISSQEVASWFGNAFAVGGKMGFQALSRSDIPQMVKAGIYGSGAEISDAIARGARLGLSEDSLKETSRQLGVGLGEAASVRGALTMAGLSGSAGFANAMEASGMFSNSIARMNSGYALQMKLGALGNMSGAAGSNEAIDMLMYSQYSTANPGSSFMDYLEDKKSGFRTASGLSLLSSVVGGANDPISRMIAANMTGLTPEQLKNVNFRTLMSQTYGSYATTEGSGIAGLEAVAKVAGYSYGALDENNMAYGAKFAKETFDELKKGHEKFLDDLKSPYNNLSTSIALASQGLDLFVKKLNDIVENAPSEYSSANSLGAKFAIAARRFKSTGEGLSGTVNGKNATDTRTGKPIG